MVTDQSQRTLPLATVDSCTSNRSKSLQCTIYSMITASKNVADMWELHIIDNGSTDDTVDIIASYQDILPTKRIDAPEAGLSNARNAGVKHASDEFIIWKDEDICVSPTWFKSYFDAFKVANHYDLFGGKATPYYEEFRAQWFVQSEPHLMSLLAISNELSWSEITETQLPWGLNYAIRTTILRQHPYDPHLGVAPGRRRGGEETAMIKNVRSSGENGKWAWEVDEVHMIRSHRQTNGYIREYYKASGKHWSYPAPNRKGFTAFSGSVARVLLNSGIKASILWLMRDARWVRHFVMTAQSYGCLHAAIRNRRSLGQ